MRQFLHNDEVDAVVIGTGAGGAPLMAKLAATGMSVVALEAGRAQDFKAFPTDEPAQRDLFWNDERLTAGNDPIPFGNNNSGTGVGGSTLHFTAFTPRVQPDDLRLHSEFGVGKDWPVSFSDLEPYYEEAERLMGISGPQNYPWGAARRSAYPLAPLPLNRPATLMEKGCAMLGIKTSPAPNAALSAPYYREETGQRNACTNRGFCQAGCSEGAKSGMDVTYIPYALQSGCELRTNAFVTGFEKERSGKIKSVVYVHDGIERRQRCKNVFLCAGAIETPRLLLMQDMANSSGMVGKNFMAHTGVQVWGTFPELTEPYKGIPGSLISEDTHRPRNADFAGGYLLQSIGVMPVTYASQVARGRGLWGNALTDHMKNYNRVAGINILGECLPYKNNFLELADEKDERGLPKPRIYFSNGDNEKSMTAHAEKLMKEIWQAAGATDIWTFHRNAHIIGTCRMGTSKDDSVVDGNGRSFDVSNLFICDNSIFPSALSVNPALTIIALSLRTAAQFLNKN